jgi:hypothetical protein
MSNDYECLDRLSLDLEKETETQKELSIRVKATLSRIYPQTKDIQKLLTANQRCSMELQRVMKKLKVPPFVAISLCIFSVFKSCLGVDRVLFNMLTPKLKMVWV